MHCTYMELIEYDGENDIETKFSILNNIFKLIFAFGLLVFYFKEIRDEYHE